MKNRIVLTLVVVVLTGLAALVWLRKNSASARKPHPEVAIEDGKAIDFSSGKPVVKDGAKEKASIDKAVKEMEDAAKGVSFSAPPPPPKPAEKK